MSRIQYFMIGLVLLVTAACGGANKESNDTEQTEAVEEVQQSSAVEETTPKTPEVPKAATRKEPAPAPTPAPPPPPKPQYATLAAGTLIPVRLQDPLDSSVNQSGDTFRAVVDQDLIAGNTVVVPKGSMVEGTLTYVERSGRVSGRAKMSLQFVNLHVGANTYPLQSEILSFEAEGTKKKDATKVGIASGIGAVVGAIAGGGKGAAIGAAAGAGAGGVTVAATRGDELKYAVEDLFEFTLSEEVRIRTR